MKHSNLLSLTLLLFSLITMTVQAQNLEQLKTNKITKPLYFNQSETFLLSFEDGDQLFIRPPYKFSKSSTQLKCMDCSAYEFSYKNNGKVETREIRVSGNGEIIEWKKPNAKEVYVVKGIGHGGFFESVKNKKNLEGVTSSKEQKAYKCQYTKKPVIYDIGGSCSRKVCIANNVQCDGVSEPSDVYCYANNDGSCPSASDCANTDEGIKSYNASEIKNDQGSSQVKTQAGKTSEH